MIGDTKLEDWTEDSELTAGEIYFKSNGSSVEYTDILIKDSDNNIIKEMSHFHIDENSDEFYAGKADC